jgi:hypothetical protein
MKKSNPQPTEAAPKPEPGPQYDHCSTCGRRYWSYTGLCPTCSAPEYDSRWDPDPWGRDGF